MLLHDLHTHSCCSDGLLPPADVVALAARAGVSHLALTDHDSTAGVAEADAAAAEMGVELIPGVEISVSWNGAVVHIVGLGVAPDHPGLNAGLARLRAHRAWRGEEMARRLEQQGVTEAYRGAVALAGGPVLARTHFARLLVGQGHAKTLNDAFRRFLKRGRPAYVAGEWAALEEAVAWIKAAGGQAVLAHPLRYGFTQARLRALLQAFKCCGGVGMEVVSGQPPGGEVSTLARLCARFGLLASAGSDFHDPGAPGQRLGAFPPLPRECRPIWSLWDGAGYRLACRA
ncbi:MAG TPA: PHP domain-containing protein [Gammaproteobacteria bacterium]|nr:PHP domain-containing protein [Gammaproteobacteria bacterium]